MLTTRHYGLVVAGIVTQSISRIEDDEGPPARFVGGDYRLLLAAPDWSAKPTPTTVLRWTDYGSAPAWEEVSPLDDLKAEAIARTYPDVDAVYDAAIGRRTSEYERAEEAARAYKAAGFTGPVSDYISGHARSNPTGQHQTDEWAAQQIIERADAFRWAELQMRNVRFDRQADMRAATTHDELQTAVAAWDGFISWLRVQLGL